MWEVPVYDIGIFHQIYSWSIVGYDDNLYASVYQYRPDTIFRQSLTSSVSAIATGDDSSMVDNHEHDYHGHYPSTRIVQFIAVQSSSFPLILSSRLTSPRSESSAPESS